MRYRLPDTLRGALLLSMIAYHTGWDLVYLFGYRVPWFTASPGYVWQQSICWGFILLSGFCLGLGPLQEDKFYRGRPVKFPFLQCINGGLRYLPRGC